MYNMYKIIVKRILEINIGWGQGLGNPPSKSSLLTPVVAVNQAKTIWQVIFEDANSREGPQNQFSWF